MKEYPILFNSEMVKAILEGRKTQTRRIVKPQPNESFWEEEAKNIPKEWRKQPCLGPGHHMEDNIWILYNADDLPSAIGYCGIKCPYGKIGDVLWVREAWCKGRPNKLVRKSEEEKVWKNKSGTYGKIIYKADISKNAQDIYEYKWTPSIHMPRWACRIRLEITNVSVERVQDISLQDKWNEGYPPELGRFEDLWNSINEKRGFGWEVNPWVWVVKFKRIEGE